MDIKTVTAYRNLEQQAIKQSQKRAFYRDFLRKNNTKSEQPASISNIENTKSATKKEGLSYHA